MKKAASTLLAGFLFGVALSYSSRHQTALAYGGGGGRTGCCCYSSGIFSTTMTRRACISINPLTKKRGTFHPLAPEHRTDDALCAMLCTAEKSEAPAATISTSLRNRVLERRNRRAQRRSSQENTPECPVDCHRNWVGYCSCE